MEMNIRRDFLIIDEVSKIPQIIAICRKRKPHIFSRCIPRFENLDVVQKPRVVKQISVLFNFEIAQNSWSIHRFSTLPTLHCIFATCMLP